ncbi:MAG: glutamine-hydrolyzing carbamoyl-phosphate synthase small subunit [Candidatus Thermoplasmatota archaeon]|nr:glutamine-hydrolyzing carbamoyl-phosphate synthase small subunit [Candidatus Thermoplasmatota archaeon]
MDRFLVLEDGTIYRGKGFGSDTGASGEVVFTTSMTGYVETLTDPSYLGQIIVFAHPTIGNYPWSEEMMESGLVHAAGVITREGHTIMGSRTGKEPLHDLLETYGVPGIDGIDTRSLIMKIREKGTMKGVICSDPSTATEFVDIGSMNLLRQLKVKRRTVSGEGEMNILMIDTGAKKSMIDHLSALGNIEIVPYDHDFSSINAGHDLLFLTNGPGDPNHPANEKMIQYVRENIGRIPVAGICLGHQIIALAAGASTSKMRFGHRGVNHSVSDGLRTFVTSQNHGYAVDTKSIQKTAMDITLVDTNDGTVEGLRNAELGLLSVQFHPEARPGPWDALSFFGEVRDMVMRFNAKKA